MIAITTLSLYALSLTIPFIVSYSYRPINIKSTLKSTVTVLKLSPIDIHDQLSIHSSHIDSIIHQLQHLNTHQSFFLSDDITSTAAATSTTEPITTDIAASVYTKTDKTGVIGCFATYIELAIDFGHSMFNKIGIVNSYGYSIILFTLLGNVTVTSFFIVAVGLLLLLLLLLVVVCCWYLSSCN